MQNKTKRSKKIYKKILMKRKKSAEQKKVFSNISIIVCVLMEDMMLSNL